MHIHTSINQTHRKPAVELIIPYNPQQMSKRTSRNRINNKQTIENEAHAEINQDLLFSFFVTRKREIDERHEDEMRDDLS